jgi:hypothetical protein
MSLISLPDGWKRFGGGRAWRCAGPRYLCEVDDAGNTPNYASMSKIATGVRRIKGVYQGRVKFGVLDEYGYALDVLVANSFTESYGTVPSPLSTRELRQAYDTAAGDDPGAKLDSVIRCISSKQKYLERREPGYQTPTSTPGRVSVGAHHVLIATAVGMAEGSRRDSHEERQARIIDLVCRLPADSLYAAELAVKYFNQNHGRHFNEPPLLAATYNAGSPRPSAKNAWNLVQYGEHLDRWIAYFNTSRMIS